MVQQPNIDDQGFSDHTLYREGQDDRSDRRSGCVSEYRWRGGCQDQHQAHFQLKFSDQSHLCIAAWLKQIVVPLVNPPPCQPLKMCDLCSWCLWTTRKVQDMLLMSLNYSKSWKPAPGVSELFERFKICFLCLSTILKVENLLLVSLNPLPARFSRLRDLELALTDFWRADLCKSKNQIKKGKDLNKNRPLQKYKFHFVGSNK